MLPIIYGSTLSLKSKNFPIQFFLVYFTINTEHSAKVNDSLESEGKIEENMLLVAVGGVWGHFPSSNKFFHPHNSICVFLMHSRDFLIETSLVFEASKRWMTVPNFPFLFPNILVGCTVPSWISTFLLQYWQQNRSKLFPLTLDP